MCYIGIDSIHNAWRQHRDFQFRKKSNYIYDSLTMLPKHFRRLNSIYFRLLRRVVGVKAAHISRVSNITVWELAGRPTTPAQLILQQQIKLLLTCLATPPNDPFHHIVFCSALRDRIECNKKSSRGRPPPHWPMTLQQLINKTPRLTGFLVAAPTCASLFPFLQLARPEQQRAGQGKKKSKEVEKLVKLSKNLQTCTINNDEIDEKWWVL